MKPRQILSMILLIIVVIMILYPTTATGSIDINAQYEQAIIETQHEGLLIVKGVTNLYISFSEIRIHNANEANQTGWIPIIYSTSDIDLVGFGNKSGKIFMTPTVPVGEYNGIMLTLSNVTTVFNGTTLQIEPIPKYFVIDYPFIVKSGTETNLSLKFTVDYRALNASSRIFFDVKPIFD